MSINAKMIEFHKRFAKVTLKRTGWNPHYKSEYFTLDDVVNAVTPCLNEIGLYVFHQTMQDDDGRHILLTSIMTEDGDKIGTSLRLPETDDPQKMISAITYYRRVNLACLVNLAEHDDDGEALAIAEAAKKMQFEPATDEQLSVLADYRETGVMTDALHEYIEKQGERLTKKQAAAAIKKCKDAEKKK